MCKPFPIGLWSVVVAAVAIMAGCEKTPCENLRAHADSCDTPASRFIPEAQSSCALSREKYGPQQFDLFADCILDSSCDTLNAVQQCRETHLPDTAASPCERFTLWGVGCGMEPATQGPECGGFANTLTAPAFGDWVDCVTQNGCPTPNDQRYVTCLAKVFPKPVENRLNTCNKIKRWADTCGPLAPEDSPISFNLLNCLGQGQVVTDESFGDYADCLLAMIDAGRCSSNTDRVLCAVSLELVTLSEERESACAKVISLGEACPGAVTGNSATGCGQLFSRFTDESFARYVACVEEVGQSCNESADFTACLPLLRFTP